MKRFLFLRSTFRTTLLLSLIFRLFFVEKLGYIWNISSYIILAISLVGIIILELLVYWYKKKVEYEKIYLQIFFSHNLYVIHNRTNM
jgi:hypothetical protein